MNCKNHKEVKASGTCVNCGSLFCEDCLINMEGKNYCKSCITKNYVNNQSVNNSESNKKNIEVMKKIGAIISILLCIPNITLVLPMCLMMTLDEGFFGIFISLILCGPSLILMIALIMRIFKPKEQKNL
jgi:hypothetical protein